MFSIEMGDCDIVLGVEWLKTIRPVTKDFKQLYKIFLKESHTHTLKDIQAIPLDIISSHCIENILKNVHFSIISQFHAIQGLETMALEPHPNM